jgi:ATP-dependent DNA helicase RecQ
VEIANLLNHHGIHADFYHAGLDPETRSKKQLDWIQDKTRVIVCTNAFGMGIDKPNVRLVVHYQPPDCIEAYFQEAGRGGRDGKPAFGALLYDERDIDDLTYQLKNAFPEKEEIRKIYQALVNYFQLAVGSGKDEYREFDLMDFCKIYNLNHLKVYKSLDLLSRNAFLNLTEAVFMPSRLMFKVNKNELYSYQVKYPKMDLIIKTILRSYSGIFDEFTPIKEKDIAFRTKLALEQIIKDLELLQKHEIIQYIKQSTLPKICFPNGVILAKNLFLEKDSYENRKKQVESRNGAFIQLLKNEEICRNQQMLGYFGEMDSEPCGRCDVCIQKRKKDPSSKQLLDMEDQIMLWIKEKSVEHDWVVEQFESKNEVREIIRHLMENGRIVQEGKWLKFQR